MEVGVAEAPEVDDVVVVAGGGVNTGAGVLDTLEEAVELELELELVAALAVAEILPEDVVTGTGVDEEVCVETSLVTELELVVLLLRVDDDSDTDVLDSAEVVLESVSVADVLVKLLVKLLVKVLVESLGILLVAKVI